jgi:hypothetical protein
LQQQPVVTNRFSHNCIFRQAQHRRAPTELIHTPLDAACKRVPYRPVLLTCSRGIAPQMSFQQLKHPLELEYICFEQTSSPTNLGRPARYAKSRIPVLGLLGNVVALLGFRLPVSTISPMLRDAFLPHVLGHRS